MAMARGPWSYGTHAAEGNCGALTGEKGLQGGSGARNGDHYSRVGTLFALNLSFTDEFLKNQ